VGKVGPEQASAALRLYVQTSHRSEDGTSFDYEQIDEVREMLEARVARIAATRATEDDLAELTKVHKQLVRAKADPEAASQFDVAFHRLIAVSTHNPLYLVMLDSIEPVLLEIRRMTLRVPGRPHRAVSAHGRILDRIVARDPEGAELAMIQHLEESRAVWRNQEGRLVL
jgi:DNA-binding FadR family transcriptional regulator